MGKSSGFPVARRALTPAAAAATRQSVWASVAPVRAAVGAGGVNAFDLVPVYEAVA